MLFNSTALRILKKKKNLQPSEPLGLLTDRQNIIMLFIESLCFALRYSPLKRHQGNFLQKKL